MCLDLEDYLKKRSKLESEYSKTLAGLSKHFKNRESIGVLESSFNMLKYEIDTMASSHQGVSVFFSQQADNLKKFREGQSVKKKQGEEAVQKTQNTKISHLAKTIQLEKSYYKKCADRDAAVAVAKETEIENPPVPQKELEKVKNRATKAGEDAQKSDNAYRSSVIVLEDHTVNWEKEMTSYCQISQELDEERIHFLRQEVWTCLNVDSKLALDIDNSCEKIRNNLEKCSISDDIQSFVQATTTGSIKPEQYRYKAYGQKSAPANEDN